MAGKITITQIDLNKLRFANVVEKYDFRMSGHGKMMIKNTFNENERKKMSKVYYKFKKWVASGTPENVTIFPSEYRLMQRMCDFFGELK